jgi:glycine cleavage system H protein
MVIAGLLYTKEHEWVKKEDDVVVMGITDHAQQMLGDITFVELPEPDSDVKQGTQIAVVESSKAASDVFSPISGKVIEANQDLEESPEFVNDSCYDRGWLCKLSLSNPAELAGLMDAPQYEAFLADEQ